MNKEFLINQLNELGVTIDDVVAERFAFLEENLLSWNKNVNLTAITDSDEIVTKHFADSLSVLPYADFEENASLIDVGCGAGFPSLPLLIARPDLNVTFLDSIGKKLNFIDDTINKLELNGTIIHDRAEMIGKNSEYRETFDYAVTRAVAPLNVLAEYCLPLVKVGGMYVSMKGAEDEVELGENAIKTLGGEIEKVVSFKLPNGDKRNLIMIKKISQTPTEYPRKAKKIDTRPL